jgi:hypothetical protein
MGAYLGKVYLASSFALIPKVIEVAESLESHGHLITVKWWGKDNINLHNEKDDNLHWENFYGHPECKKIFNRDFEGIKQCHLFVLVAGDTPQKFNGANIELGIALALGKTCCSVGKLENCVLYYPLFKFDTIKDLTHWICQQMFPNCEDELEFGYDDFDPSPDDYRYDDEDRDITKRR